MPKINTAPVQAGESVTRKQFIPTVAPVQAGDFTGLPAEFGRTRDVERCFGLKRGTIYNLARDGKIKGCVIRSRGQKSGCRLWEMDSIREYIRSQMDQA